MEICHLPAELLDEIFKHFDGVTLARSKQVCRVWRELHKQSKYNLIWRRACFVEVDEDVLREVLADYVSDGSLSDFSCRGTLEETFNKQYLSEISWLDVYREWFRSRHVGKWPCLMQEFHGHEGVVYDARFSGDRVVSCGEDSTICVWDSWTRECLHICTGHLGPVLCIALGQRQGCLPDGNHSQDLIVSGSRDCSIKVWHLCEKQCLYTLHGHTHWVTCVAVEGDIALSGSEDYSTRIWDINKGTSLHQLKHMDWVKHVAFWQGKSITVTDSGAVEFWSLHTAERLFSAQIIEEQESRSSGISGVVVRGGKVLLITGDRRLILWQRAPHGNEDGLVHSSPLTGSPNSISQVGTSVTMRCSLVAVGTRYGAVYFYDCLQDWEKQFTNIHSVVQSGASNINSVALGDDGEGPCLVTAGDDGIVRVHRWFGPSAVRAS